MKSLVGILLGSVLVMVGMGCSKQQPNEAQLSREKPKLALKETFKTQLIGFVSSAGRVNAATEIGISRQELQRLVSEAKGQFEVLEAIWPQGFCPESKKDFEQAIRGWSLAASGEFGSKYGDAAAKELEKNLEDYEAANPFGVKFQHLEPGIIPLTSRWGERANNMPLLLAIASKYHQRAKEPVLQALKD